MSTPEAEIVSLNRALREFALPLLDLFALLCNPGLKMQVLEDNESAIKIIRAGYSSKMSHLTRTHKMSLAWLSEVVAQPGIDLRFCPTLEQKGDLFTKALDRIKLSTARDMVGIKSLAVALLQLCRDSDGP
jgi:hypothetical protein